MRICPVCFGLYAADQTNCPKDGAATERHTDVLIGRQLGPYVARSLIGEGGMGVVYAGEHTTLGKRVALKVLRPELSLRDDIVERFIQEARAVSTIGHSNIVNIYDFGRTPFGSFFFVMEYLDGQTLRHMLETGGPQPLERVRMVVNGVGAALAAAHAKGFVHRDVKPENIMLVNRAGQEAIKLLDFGIVKLLSPDRRSHTTTMHSVGTPQYMCPEQLEDAPIDYRADIYGLGSVAYELLTGAVPYPGKSQAEVRQLQLTQMPAPPSVCRSESRLSRALDAAVLWSISLDPAARPRRMEDFVAAFQTGYERTLVEQSHAPSAADPGRRRVLIGSVVAAVTLAAAGGTAYWVMRGRHAGAGTGSASGSSPGTAAKPDAAPPALPGQTNEQIAAQAREALLKALKAPEASLRIAAAKAIGEGKRKAFAPEVRKLLEAPETAKDAAEALLALEDADAVPALTTRMEKSPPGTHKSFLARVLVKLGAGSAKAKAIVRKDADQGSYLSTPALECLAEAGDAEAAAKLEQRVKDNSLREYKVLHRCLAILAAAGNEAGSKRLHEELSQPEWRVRVDAAHALGKADEVGMALLLEALKAPAPESAQLQAAVVLAHFGDERGRNTLIQSLRSKNTAERQEAALALAHLPMTDEARTALRWLLKDKAPEVALAAAVALAAP